MRLIALARRLDATHWIMLSVAFVSLIAFGSERVKRKLILQPHLVRRGKWYRLLTAGWIHADLGHLATNMVVLYVFAGPVHARFGPVVFAGLYTSAVIVAFLPSTVRYRNQPRYQTLGASGAVAAVMLSAILLEPTKQLLLFFFPIPVPAIVFGAIYIVYSMWHSWGAEDGINHDAHFSGALWGALATWIWAPASVAQAVRIVRRLLGI